MVPPGYRGRGAVPVTAPENYHEAAEPRPAKCQARRQRQDEARRARDERGRDALLGGTDPVDEARPGRLRKILFTVITIR